MEFGWINLFGAVIVLLMMIPNIVYAIRSREKNGADADIPKYLAAAEQVGRYGCILLMWLPLFVRKFGFGSVAGLLAYLLLNGVLLAAYYVCWILYARKKTPAGAMALAVIPAGIFLLSGILLRHWCLAVFAVIFGAAHCLITCAANHGRQSNIHNQGDGDHV